MGRQLKGTAPGRTSDFTGEKKAWLEGFHQELLDAGFGSGGGDPGAVYTDVTNRFLQRYGYDLPFSENVDGDPLANLPPVLDPVPQEEKDWRQKIRKQLRAVSDSKTC
jgi:hypothetical protein